MSDFLSMGEFGAFVWSSYGITVALLLGLALISVHSMRSRRRELDALEDSRRSRREKAARSEKKDRQV